MVSLEQLIYQTLTGNAGLVGLMGTNWYSVQIAQNPSYPVGAYQRISTVPISTQQQNAAWQGWGWARFQFTVWCQGSSAGIQCDTIARAIQSAMLGLNAGVPQGSPEVGLPAANYLVNRRMLVEPDTSPPLFKAVLDYRIFYTEQ